MLRLYNRVKESKNTLKKIFDEKKNTLIIHYSCESFYDIENGKTPRITSIAIKYLDTENDVSFSIHKIAEINGISIQDIDNQYDTLEKQMLDEFYNFVIQHQCFNWIHWNMKNINYGFLALEHRYRVLKGQPIHIQDEKTINLASILYSIYGKDYIKNPKLYNLIELNNIKHQDLLSGNEEATAFKDKEFVKLHQSTLRKIDAIYTILDFAYCNKLKTKSSFLNKNEGFILGLAYLINEHPIISAFITISGWLVAMIPFLK